MYQTNMILLCSVLYTSIIITLYGVYGADRVRYISTEHSVVTWINPKYVNYTNLTSQRHGRGDPFYYMGYHTFLLQPINYNVNLDLYVYEFLSNEYRRSFFELHFEVCSLVDKDLLFGISLKGFIPPCPIPRGPYHLENLTVPLKHVPDNMPFSKGRLYLNFTSTQNKDSLGWGHVDIEVKEISTKRLKVRQKSSL